MTVEIARASEVTVDGVPLPAAHASRASMYAVHGGGGRMAIARLTLCAVTGGAARITATRAALYVVDGPPDPVATRRARRRPLVLD